MVRDYPGAGKCLYHEAGYDFCDNGEGDGSWLPEVVYTDQISDLSILD